MLLDSEDKKTGEEELRTSVCFVTDEELSINVLGSPLATIPERNACCAGSHRHHVSADISAMASVSSAMKRAREPIFRGNECGSRGQAALHFL